MSELFNAVSGFVQANAACARAIADPLDAELARLRDENARLKSDLEKALCMAQLFAAQAATEGSAACAADDELARLKAEVAKLLSLLKASIPLIGKAMYWIDQNDFDNSDSAYDLLRDLRAHMGQVAATIDNAKGAEATALAETEGSAP